MRCEERKDPDTVQNLDKNDFISHDRLQQDIGVVKGKSALHAVHFTFYMLYTLHSTWRHKALDELSTIFYRIGIFLHLVLNALFLKKMGGHKVQVLELEYRNQYQDLYP